MRICEVIGTVTLNRWEPSLTGARWKVVVPFTEAALRGDAGGRGEPFIVYDELGCGTGDLVAISEGAEAAAPFAPEVKPIDGYVAAILDSVELPPIE
jgi:ethanolamine utilization protein EutN